MADISNATLAQQISDLINLWRNRELQFQAWLTGTATGGPSNNGIYPLTDYQGNSYNVPSPAEWSAQIAALTASGTGAVSSATTQATAAAASATAAASSASAASTSASAAATSATNAATSAANSNANYTATYALWQATTTLKGNASASATAAAASATAAAGSASTASTQATNSSNSASASASSASAASSSASAAAGSATAASGSASAASTSATNAASSATSASGSASTATTQATNSSNSATASANSASAAATSASNAASSASAAATSASNASTSASTASTQATNAASSASAAAASATTAATFNPALYAALAGATFTGNVTAPTMTVSGTETHSATGIAGNSWFTPSANQQLYSILGSSVWGPGIQARWDSSTSNRYLDLGFYTQPGNGWNSTMKLQDGAITVAGTMALASTLAVTGVASFGSSVLCGAGAAVYTAGDMSVSRNSAPTTGVIYFGNSATKYLYYDGTNFNFVGSTQINASYYSSAYAATSGSVVGVILNNTNSSMQTALEFQKNGAISGRIRSDYAGNLSYVSTASGVHSFFTGGDSGTGTQSFVIGSGNYQSNLWYNIGSGMYTQFANASGQSYGTLRVGGGNGGYVGVELMDGSIGPTFMSSTSLFGVYCQTAGRWSWYDDGSVYRIVKPAYDQTNAQYYCRNAVGNGTIKAQSGGSASGGNAGDIIFIY